VGTFEMPNSDGPPTKYMVAFDQSGSVRWTVEGYRPQIATADGGVIATDDSGAAATFDQNGNATGQMGSLPVQSWTGNTYQYGSTIQALLSPVEFASSFAASSGGNQSSNGTYVKTYDAPQQAAYKLYTTDLKAQPKCDALMAQLANMANIPKDILIAQLRATALGVRDYVFDGPSSKTQLDPVKFPGIAYPGVTTVGEWFSDDSSREGLSQYNGEAIWVNLDEWHSWIGGYFSPMLINSTGKVNYYGMGTMMHEILHKQAVGGGFRHDAQPGPRDLNVAIGAVGWPPLTVGHNNDSEAIGRFCFGSLQ